jgi:zinc protease
MKRFSLVLSLFGANALLVSQQCLAQKAELVSVSPSLAQMTEKVDPKKDTMVLAYEKWKLPNGLTILIHEDHSDPIVNVSVQYHVGSARESIGKSGFAHLFEHMMFQGSEHVKDEEHFRLISEAGGTMNGFTQEDITFYFETLPSNNLDMALWLEADRMGFLLDSLTKEKFEVQRGTVKNEKSQNYENQPYALGFGEVLAGALYPAGHPYSWPVIGFTDDLDRVTLDDVKKFFMRWYGPNNAVLCISGDVNPKEVIASVEKYYGSIPAGREVKKAKAQVPILNSDKYANYVDNIYQPLTLMVFPTVPAYHRDQPALDMLAGMLGEGNNTVFYKNFDKAEKGNAGVSHQAKELSGEFGIGVFAYPDFETDITKQFNETESLIRASLEEFEKAGVSDSALAREKAKRQASIIDGAGSVFGKAYMLSQWQLLGKPYNIPDELDRYNKVTKEDITRVYNKYIKGKFAAIVNVFPRDPESKDSTKSYNPYANLKANDSAEYAGLAYVKGKDVFDRAMRPLPGAPKTPVIPQYYTQTLKNGLKIIGTKSSEIPEVVITITLNGGDLLSGDDPKKVGVAGLTAAMLDEGTKNFTTEQISAKLDELGSTVNFSAGTETSTITVVTLTKNLDATLKLLEEKLLNPGFHAADFKRVKRETIEATYNAKKNADVIANNLFRNLVYGNNLLGAYVTEKNIKKLTLEDVKNYYQQNYSPSVASLVVVGDVSEKDILPKLEFLNKWEAKEVKMPVITPAPVALPNTVYVAHKDFAASSVINIGYAAMPYDYNGEYYKSNIMNYCFGGSFNSRLNLNLREDKEFTYGIRSGFSGTKYPGFFQIAASVRRTATDSSLAEIFKEIKEFQTGLKDEEVTFTKSALLNSEALRYETLFQKAGFLSRIARYDLPGDYTMTQSKILKEVTKDELNSLGSKYIDKNRMIILVVGNKYAIKDKIEKLGLGKVKEVELE